MNSKIKLMNRAPLVLLIPAFLLSTSLCIQASEHKGDSPEMQSPEAMAEKRDGIFIHLSSGPDQAHRVLMALRMAEIMMEDKDVLVYCDIEGVRMLTKDAPDLKKFPFHPSSEMLKKLIDGPAIVMACPGCMKAAGIEKEDLIDGVQVADKDTFFNFTKGRILTIDY